MSTTGEVLQQTGYAAPAYVMVGLFVTAGLLLVLSGWRASLAVLLMQYVLSSALLMEFVRKELAVTALLTNSLVCIMLYLSARQVDRHPMVSLLPSRTGTRRARHRPRPWHAYSSNVMFRVLLMLLAALATYVLVDLYPLPLPQITPVCYWLLLMGLLVLSLTEDPLKAGQGLLTLLGGFQLIFLPLEGSLVMAWLWGAFMLLLGLAISYLTVADRVRRAGEGE